MRLLDDEPYGLNPLGYLSTGETFTADALLRAFLIQTANTALGFDLASSELVVEHGGGSAQFAAALGRAGFTGLYLLHDLQGR